MNRICKENSININHVETLISGEVTSLANTTSPFAWINRRGAIVQDYAMEMGEKRTADMIERCKFDVTYDQLFDYWIRVDGLLIVINTKPTQKQINALVDFMGEFPELYGKLRNRIKFVSNKYKNIKFTKLGEFNMEEI